MSRIGDLVARLCPDGVDWVPLGELGTFIRGRRFTKDDYVESGLGSIHYGEIYTKFGTTASAVDRFVRPELASGLRLARTGDLVIAATGENVEDVCKAVAWLGHDEVAVHDDCYIYRHTLDPTFVSYFFQSAGFHDQKVRFASESKLARVSGANLARILIPNPPRGVQEEIVQILNEFSNLHEQLETELQAELTARRAQFVHYRNSLLAFDSLSSAEVSWALMGELGEFVRGRRFTKADYVESGVPCIHYGEIYTYYGTSTKSVHSHVRDDLRQSLRFAQHGDVVFTDVGETVEDVGKAVAWLGEFDIAIHDHCYAYRHPLNPVFVAYYMQTARFQSDKAMHVARTKVKTLLISGLARVPIPVPTRETQEDIVRVLGRLEALVAELTTAIPEEIEARRDQYRYFRDRLFEFERSAA